MPVPLFNLNIAPSVVTKVMKPISQVLSHLGIEIHQNLEDWLIQVSYRPQCEVHHDLTLSMACQRGFLINLAKSHLVLTQTIVWLGMKWDSRTANLHVSQ